jgi:hypothetical protein
MEPCSILMTAIVILMEPLLPWGIASCLEIRPPENTPATATVLGRPRSAGFQTLSLQWQYFSITKFIASIWLILLWEICRYIPFSTGISKDYQSLRDEQYFLRSLETRWKRAILVMIYMSPWAPMNCLLDIQVHSTLSILSPQTVSSLKLLFPNFAAFKHKWPLYSARW